VVWVIGCVWRQPTARAIDTEQHCSGTLLAPCAMAPAWWNGVMHHIYSVLRLMQPFKDNQLNMASLILSALALSFLRSGTLLRHLRIVAPLLSLIGNRGVPLN
jgi:hypothetical protein